jgi:hypothetical protein
MDLLERLELRLRAKISAQLAREGRVDYRRLELAVQTQRELLVDALLRLLDDQVPTPTPPWQAPAPPPPASTPASSSSVPGVKEHPTPEILEKAVKLQALAIHSPEEHERAAAWRQFENLWQKYHLPVNLGI